MITKPIIFSTPMIQAILNGRKTQTRRVLKPQPHKYLPEGKYRYDGLQEFIPAIELLDANGEPTEKYFSCGKPRYQPNDLLWVREVWRYCEDANGYCYKASQPYEADNCRKFASVCAHSPKWRSPIHMPKEAARIWLRVTGVKVERLNDISNDDAKAEGIPEGSNSTHFNLDGSIKEHIDYTDYIEEYRELWDKIHKNDGYHCWNLNPWVFVYEFERIEEPEGWLSA